VASDFHGFHVYDVALDGALTRIAGEVAHRRFGTGKFRSCEGIDARADGTIICGNFNYADVYRLLPAGAAGQGDLDVSPPRIRLRPEGGAAPVTVSNDGDAPVTVTDVTANLPSFTCDWTGGVIEPGQAVTFTITYDGNPAQGIGLILLASDDPDENPLPIQVFGATNHPDPGELAPDFTLPYYTRDENGIWSSVPYTLSDRRGRVVWLSVYGTW
jgi:hypothetical protein